VNVEHRIAILVLFTCMGGSAAARAEPPVVSRQAFAYGFALEPADDSGVYRTTLAADVYRRTTRSDLGDLCVFNGRGEVVPHALRPAPALEQRESGERQLPWFVLQGQAARPAAPLEVEVDAARGGAVVRVSPAASVAAGQEAGAYLLDASEIEQPITDLYFTFAGDASEVWARLHVESSQDLEHWQDAGSGVLAVLEREGQRLESRRIEVTGPLARYLRLSASAGRLPALASVTAGFDQDPGHVPLASAVVAAKSLPDGGLLFDSGAHFPVERASLRLRERSALLRAVLLSSERRDTGFVERFAGLFYRLDGVALVSPPAPLHEITRDRFYRLTLDRRSGGIGNELPELELHYRPDEILWVARGNGPFTLAYGSATTVGGALTPEEIAGPAARIAPARLGARRELGGPAQLRHPPAPPLPWKVYALWATLVLAAGIVIMLSIRLARRET
jgi:hypothetical protein